MAKRQITVPRSRLAGFGGKKSNGRQTTKRADIGDIGTPAPMWFENFGTLLGFEASLDLLSGRNFEPPDMNKGNTPRNMENLKDDPKRPSKQEISRGLGKGYDNAPDSKPEKVPHENENVSQTNPNADSTPPKVAAPRKRADVMDEGPVPDGPVNEDLTSQEYEQNIQYEGNSEVGPDEQAIPQAAPEDDGTINIEDMKNEYSEKYMIASQLADLKIQAGQINEEQRHAFIRQQADTQSLNSLKAIYNELSTYSESLQTAASRRQPTHVVPSPQVVPKTAGSRTQPMDGLSSILMGF